MDGFKDVFSLLAALVGLISALIPLFGYLADKKRRANALAEARSEVPRAVSEPLPEGARPAEVFEPAPVRTPQRDRAAFARAEQLVRNPAIFMIVVGALSLTTNLLTAGIGFIDEFVTPLGIRPPRDFPMRGGPDGPFGPNAMQPEMAASERGTTVVGIIGILFFSLASAIAIWSVYNMLKLRNYWLALAGSIALIPGSCICCMLGLPSGIWSLIVLINPDLKGAFR